MEITKINRTLTRPGQIAFETNPPLTREVFDRAMEVNGQVLAAYSVSFQDSCFIVGREEIQPNDVYMFSRFLDNAFQDIDLRQKQSGESHEALLKRLSKRLEVPLSD